MSNLNVYHDVAANVNINQGVATIDFLDRQGLMPQQPADKLQFELTERIVLSLPAFLQLHGLMSQVVAKMEKDGLVKRGQAPAQAQAPAAE